MRGGATRETRAAVHATVSPRGEFLAFPADAIEQSISDRFEQQADRFSNRIAVQTRSERLTYSELDDWANRVAHAILARRGEAEEPVGLLLGQGSSAIAAVLGVLKAGKVYVPLDPSYPLARLVGMLEWAGAGIVATDSTNAELARSLIGEAGRLVEVDRLRGAGDGGRPGLSVSPDAVAYVFFTSGSTGRPKGVFDSHRNVLHNIRRYTNALAIGSDDRLTLLQSCAFSGSVSSLFGALLNGATTFPFSLSEEGPGRLAELLLRQRLTMYHSVPAIFRSFLTGTDYFPELRVIRLEGDRASSLDVALYRRHFDPACVLANGLGTTETGLCRQYVIDRSTDVGGGILPVGYPVEDMNVELLDDEGGPVEAGGRGEIAVRSRYLALGYWRRPDLTELAFRPDPAGGPERIYRTGDMGRLREDGCLEYLARKDFQLKVRGHRVDVADVESALICAQGVTDAVVTTLEEDGRQPELVAYLVQADAAPLDANALRRSLANTLPSHLVPTRFLQLDALPLDDNGKVDRGALPAPERVALQPTGRVPREPLERKLVEIWEEVLGVSPIGIDESFVELGGDSLAAAVIVAQIESELGRRVTPAQLAEGSTVGRLAQVLRADQEEAGGALAAIQPHGSLPPLFLVHDLLGEVARYRDLAGCLGDQPVWGLRCASNPDGIELMAKRYLAEMRWIQPSGPYRLGGWCFGAVVAFEMAHQLRASGEQVALLALIGISAWDFPQLVAPDAWHRYRMNAPIGIRARTRVHLSTARGMRAPAAIGYLMRKSVRLIRRGARLPASSVQSRSREVFARYNARPYPGRALLVLSREETTTYSSDPESDWSGLCSNGVDVLMLPGNHHAILGEPNVHAVADRLRESLQKP